MRWKTAITVTLAAALTLGACGGSTATDSKLELTPVEGIQELVDSPPAGLVVLDIRTPEEFATGHLSGAINIDYRADDFESKLAQCRGAIRHVLQLGKPVRQCTARNGFSWLR